MRLREVIFLLLVGATLLALGAFAWATAHPDAPILERLSTRPLVGPLADWVRREWGGRARPAERLPAAPERGGNPRIVVVGPVGEQVEEPALLELPELPELPEGRRVWVHGGQRLYLAPDHAAGVVARFAFPTEGVVLEVGEQRWRRVATGLGVGWLELRDEPVEPPQGREPDPVLPVAGREPDGALLERATELLGAGAREGRLGPWPLLTDLADRGLLVRLDRLAGSLPEAYAEQVELELLDQAREQVVLFADPVAYLRFAASDPQLLGVEIAGHFGRGLVALPVGERPLDEVESTLLHELTHTLVRRSIGPALPPWLAEGLAEHFAHGEIDAEGRLDPDRRRRIVEQHGQETRWRGDQAARRRVARRFGDGRGPSVAELLELDPDAFRQPPAADRYALATILVGHLFGSRHERGFAAFLAAVASGAQPTRERLESELGIGADQLEAEIRLVLGVDPR